MAGNFSATQINTWLNAITAGTYVALHFDHPEVAGPTSEYSGGGYARDTTTWTAASNKSVWNTGNLAYSGLVAGTVSYLAGYTALAGGTLQWWIQLPTPRQVASGAGYLISANDIVLAFP